MPPRLRRRWASGRHSGAAGLGEKLDHGQLPQYFVDRGRVGRCGDHHLLAGKPDFRLHLMQAPYQRGAELNASFKQQLGDGVPPGALASNTTSAYRRSSRVNSLTIKSVERAVAFQSTKTRSVVRRRCSDAIEILTVAPLWSLPGLGSRFDQLFNQGRRDDGRVNIHLLRQSQTRPSFDKAERELRAQPEIALLEASSAQ